jgi:hypothetical protein
MNKETLEEAAEKYADEYKGEEQDPWFDFMEGAKWQQNRSYSEKELEVAFFEGRENNLTFIEFFEQFKKK